MRLSMRNAACAAVLSTFAISPPTAGAVCESQAEAPIVLRPVRDSRIMQAHPSANDGAAGLVWLKRSSHVRGMIGFDLSCQPAATRDLECAGLEVSIYEGLPTIDGSTFSAHRMTVPWVEGNQSFNEFSYGGEKLGTFSGTGAGMTWDCRVDGDVSDATSDQCSGLDRWDGADDSETLIAQNYGTTSDFEAHFDYLLPFFRSREYVKIEGMPVLAIYNLQAQHQHQHQPPATSHQPPAPAPAARQNARAPLLTRPSPRRSTSRPSPRPRMPTWPRGSPRAPRARACRTRSRRPSSTCVGT